MKKINKIENKLMDWFIYFYWGIDKFFDHKGRIYIREDDGWYKYEECVI